VELTLVFGFSAHSSAQKTHHSGGSLVMTIDRHQVGPRGRIGNQCVSDIFLHEIFHMNDVHGSDPEPTMASVLRPRTPYPLRENF
jgi:hypothetical protein